MALATALSTAEVPGLALSTFDKDEPFYEPPLAETGARTETGAGLRHPPRTLAPDASIFGRIATVSPAMQETVLVLRRLARTEVTVTLTGETGTGKDVVAHAIHNESPRGGEPFVVFDCGAIPANLAESELFGHEKGAFTGAIARHEGAFERALGGTLFLDEIGELPLDLQPKLLRALENRTVRRVGGRSYRRADVRIIAATNRDLSDLVTAKHFRQDLFFRLAAAVVRLPPLRERPEDLALLTRRLLDDLDRPEVTLTPAALEHLRAYTWPGNIRELKNTLACALAFVDAGSIEPRHLRLLPPAQDEASLDRLPLGGQKLEHLERVAIKQTLLQTKGNKVQAAHALGIAVSTLYEKLKKYQF